MSEAQIATAAQAATVYFIDDSATMREVIKIAFKKENIQVVTCPSVAAAIEQFGKQRPDAVISDVIMPDRDGYELCSYVKQHAELGGTPVILMSGVVNRTVAEKATVVRADELLRKPFQPQELVARVKKLLRLEAAAEPSAAVPGREAAGQPGGASGTSPANGRGGLGDLFATPLPGMAPVATVPPAAPVAQAAQIASPEAGAPAGEQQAPAGPADVPVARTEAQAPSAAPTAAPAAARPAAPSAPRTGGAQAPTARPPAVPAAPARTQQKGPAPSIDAQRLRLEMQRLELLVRKLQAELEAERQYCQALEAHIRALQGAA